jgi:hypothetical protein
VQPVAPAGPTHEISRLNLDGLTGFIALSSPADEDAWRCTSSSCVGLLAYNGLRAGWDTHPQVPGVKATPASQIMLVKARYLGRVFL